MNAPSATPRERLVIIGNGMAPGRMLERLFERDLGRGQEQYAVTIFNAEPRVNYNRLMLSPVLSGEKTYQDIITHDDDWYDEHGVTLHKNARMTAIDRVAKIVSAANGVTQAASVALAVQRYRTSSIAEQPSYQHQYQRKQQEITLARILHNTSNTRNWRCKAVLINTLKKLTIKKSACR